MWRSLLKTITQKIEAKGDALNGDAVMTEAMKVVNAHLVQFEAAGPKKGHLFVRQVRVRRCRDESLGILTYQLSSMLGTALVQMDQSLHLILMKLGFEIMEGTAPRNELERVNQKQIEELKAQLAKK